MKIIQSFSIISWFLLLFFLVYQYGLEKNNSSIFDQLLTMDSQESSSKLHERFIAPHASLTPTDVVTIQLAALANNDWPAFDNGIKVAYNFTSATNRTYTGSLSQFTEMLHTKEYSPLIHNQNFKIENEKIKHQTATIRAMIVDEKSFPIIYVFKLSKQDNSPYKNCWLTDAIYQDTTSLAAFLN